MAKARATGPTPKSSAVEASAKSSKDQSIPSFSLISPPLIHVKFRKFAVNLALSAGDCVLMRPSKSSKLPSVAKVEKIESDSRGGNVKIHVRRYFRPEESIGRRRQFHGYKELFLSDRHDILSADTIEGKCTVHSFKSYRKLDAIGHNDFFWRFEYNSTTGAFSPDQVAVYCLCDMPYNPDDVMVKCQDCKDRHDFDCVVFLNIKGENEIRCKNVTPSVSKGAKLFEHTSWSRFHPACVSMTQEEAITIEHFICQTCAPEEQNNLQI